MAQFRATVQNTKDQLGLALLPVLDSVMQTFSMVADKILPPLIDFVETRLVPALEDAAFFFDAFMAALLAGENPIDALTGALRDIGFDEVANAIVSAVDTVVGAVTRIKNWVQTNWPIVRDTTLGIFSEIKAWVDENWPAVREVILTAVEAIKAWFVENWPII